MTRRDWEELCVRNGPPAPDELWVCPLFTDEDDCNWDDGLASLKTDGSAGDTLYVRADIVSVMREQLEKAERVGRTLFDTNQAIGAERDALREQLAAITPTTGQQTEAVMTPREELIEAVHRQAEAGRYGVNRREIAAVLDALTTGPLLGAMVKRALGFYSVHSDPAKVMEDTLRAALCAETKGK